MFYFDYFLILWMLFINSSKKIILALSRGPLLGLACFLMPLIIYFFIINFKFQMILIYTIYIFFIIFYLTLIVLNYDKRNFKINIKGVRKIIINIAVISIAFLIIFPIGKFNYKLADYSIGTKAIELTNNERKDYFANKNRALKLKLFFPINRKDNKGKKQDYLFSDSKVFKTLDNITRKEKIFLKYLSSRRINSYLGADIKKDLKNIPVVVLSHKIGYLSEHYIGICEKLASKGYFVIAINHTYLSKFVDINGELITFNKKILPFRKLNKDFDSIMQSIQLNYKKDILDVINLVEKINEEQYKFSLDTNNISLIGHGIGGGASIDIASEDNRIKNIIAIDPTVEFINKSLLESNYYNLLVFKSSEFHIGNNNNLKIIKNTNKGYIDIYEIKNSLSKDFTSLEYISPFSNILGFTKASNIKKVHKIEVDFLENMKFK